ncbi:hypothetical protein [Sinorhizobium meliloti]|uniref:hypothetical protein n=1 Tax=Rhizobium meliloti TaxID=382 RepID=UPI001F215076|nr:hypothetical protein [Sinorhizobium meliloti]
MANHFNFYAAVYAIVNDDAVDQAAERCDSFGVCAGVKIVQTLGEAIHGVAVLVRCMRVELDCSRRWHLREFRRHSVPFDLQRLVLRLNCLDRQNATGERLHQAFKLAV